MPIGMLQLYRDEIRGLFAFQKVSVFQGFFTHPAVETVLSIRLLNARSFPHENNFSRVLFLCSDFVHATQARFQFPVACLELGCRHLARVIFWSYYTAQCLKEERSIYPADRHYDHQELSHLNVR